MTEATPAQIDAPAPPANATEAGARLESLKADGAWTEKLLSGDGAATKEFNDLHAMIDAGDPVEMAMAGIVPGDVPDSGTKLMAEVATLLRSFGIEDAVVRQTLAHHEMTQQEYDSVQLWKSQHMRNPEFTARLIAGDPEAAKQLLLANIVLSSTIKKESAA